MQTAGFEFIPDQPQPEHPAPESVFFVVRLRPAGGGFFLHQRLMGDRQAKLDVGFYLSGMEGAVKKPEFHGSFGEGGMKVQSMVACPVVMLVPLTARLLRIPDILELFHCLRLFPVDGCDQLFVHLFAVPKPVRVNPQGFVEDILLACHDVYDIPQCLRGEKGDRKSTRLNSSHLKLSRMPSSA